MSLERQILLFFTEIVRQLLMPREQKPSSLELYMVVFQRALHQAFLFSLHCAVVNFCLL